eukprot:gene45-703_t
MALECWTANGRRAGGGEVGISDCKFTFATAKTIKEMSVVQVTTAAIFNTMGQPMPGGPHDLRLGEFRYEGQPRDAKCPTCNQQRDCPGHVGHIDLPTTCYNPLIFNELNKLLKFCCQSCNHLKISREKANLYEMRFALLERGFRLESELLKQENFAGARFKRGANPFMQDMDQSETHTWTVQNASSSNKNSSEAVEDFESTTETQAAFAAEIHRLLESDREKVTEGLVELIEKHNIEPQVDASTTFMESWHQLKAELEEDLGMKCCENCGSKNTAFRKDGYTKMFLKRTDGEVFIKAVDIRNMLRKTWAKDKALMEYLFPGSKETGADMFFIDTLAVTPNRLRPLAQSTTGAGESPHDQTKLYACIMDVTRRIVEATASSEMLQQQKNCGGEEKISSKKVETIKLDKDGQVIEDESNQLQKKSSASQAIGSLICELQEAVNALIDSSKGKKTAGKFDTTGVRQKLEKKQGLFRMNMMGKRVNFAARSVISPDNNLAPNEIGIPKHMAMKLTFPEPVNRYNLQHLQRLVLAGPNHYPGANAILEGGKVKLLGDANQRAATMKMLGHAIENQAIDVPQLSVFRHYRDGDPLLVNRQPTLHKPGIMAHKAKVLDISSTIRMHYANCNTYNADFDGDEINLHAPQDYLAWAECYNIMLPDYQYLVPTSGGPLRGIIQDHVASGVFLTQRSTFLTKDQVCHLLYVGLAADTEIPITREITKFKETGKIRIHPEEVEAKHQDHFDFILDPPAILKPERRWTGKQVVSMVLKTLRRRQRRVNKDKGNRELENEPPQVGEGLFCSFKTKTSADIWGGFHRGAHSASEEGEVIIRDDDMLTGVIDKASIGATAYGLVHNFYEHVGPAAAGQLLGVCGKLFTFYLQQYGFTCAFRDFLITKDADDERNELIRATRTQAWDVMKAWLKENGAKLERNHGEGLDDALKRACGQVLRTEPTRTDKLEGLMLRTLGKKWGNTIDTCIPKGQSTPFPENCFSTMIQTGAKGSKINHSQISALMGQQELEGHRVPLLPSYRGLPCFSPHDLSARANGYIMDRFLTGIRPQEYFFHCMAGREGLIDTAVKTARSGYLQRCLVKHLEPMFIAHDNTVRDSDGSIIEFIYGEDGIDVTKGAYVSKFQQLHENLDALRKQTKSSKSMLRQLKNEVAKTKTTVDDNISSKENKKLLPPALQSSELPKMYQKCADQWKELYALAGSIKPSKKRKDALRSALFDSFDLFAESAGAVLSENDMNFVTTEFKVLKKKAELLHQNIVAGVPRELDPVSSFLSPHLCLGVTSEKHTQNLNEFVQMANADGQETIDQDTIDLLNLKFNSSLAQYGEAVGCVAAQSMGEPSTQMTLNTFHLAGHGGANVTLGIPRLRELVQMATKKIMTPCIRVPMLGDVSLGQKIAKEFSQVSLKSLVSGVSAKERAREVEGLRERVFGVSITFVPIGDIVNDFPHLSRKKLTTLMSGEFCSNLAKALEKDVSLSKKAAQDSEYKGGRSTAKTLATDNADNEDAMDGAEISEKVGDNLDTDGIGEQDQEKEKVDKDAARKGEADADDDVSDDEDDGADDSEDEVPAKKQPVIDTDSEDDDDENDNDDVDNGREHNNKGGIDFDVFDDVNDETVDENNVVCTKSGLSIKQKGFNGDSFVIHVSMDCSNRVMLVDTVLNVVQNMFAHSVPGISRSHLHLDQSPMILELEGMNFQKLWDLNSDIIDHNKIYANDVHALLNTYGVEAARKSIVDNVLAVFGHYGIKVDPRHLNLVSDTMTARGGYRPFNRTGMVNQCSPLLQMTFESTVTFMSKSCMQGRTDTLNTASSAIVMGKNIKLGTNVFEVHTDESNERWRRIKGIDLGKQRKEFSFDRKKGEKLFSD